MGDKGGEWKGRGNASRIGILPFPIISAYSLCSRLTASHHPMDPTGYKITICTNRTPPQLTALFEDLLAGVGAGMSQALAAGAAGECEPCRLQIKGSKFSRSSSHNCMQMRMV